MPKPILYNSLLTVLFVLFVCKVQAQNVTNYTSNNKVLVTLHGINRAYNFTSDELLVRYNNNTQKLECVLNIATLLPINDTIPPNMAYDVFFAAKYPDLVLFIDAPVEKVSGSNLYPGSINKTTTISLQGATKQMVIPLALTADRNAIVFNTSFDLMLDNFSASVPVQYFNLLTGRIMITLNNARWVGMEIR
ncbi:hypothetical protein [uncultured Pontibacter sp.]|uniref:hypothetical protein n=1 Tax=uncultured Pontibacter sp. TaxID=453356 RepID=UPI002632F3E0|nr:hypothetical protein [uncultured Pontibacter sp.]